MSTSEVYGDPLVHPQPETYWGNVDPVGPRACYDESKRFGEALVIAMRQGAAASAANVVRVFNTYGPRMRRDDGRVIPELPGGRPRGPAARRPRRRQPDPLVLLCRPTSSTGCSTWSLDPVADGEILNIGNPAEITIGELAAEIRRLVRPDAEIRFGPRREGDPERRRPDIARITARYGWTPRVALAEGLRLTAEWFAAEIAREAAATA